jgi:hypothetical protein
MGQQPSVRGVIEAALPDSWSMRGINDRESLVVVGYDGGRDAIDLEPVVGAMRTIGFETGYMVPENRTVQFRREP